MTFPATSCPGSNTGLLSLSSTISRLLNLPPDVEDDDDVAAALFVLALAAEVDDVDVDARFGSQGIAGGKGGALELEEKEPPGILPMRQLFRKVVLVDLIDLHYILSVLCTALLFDNFVWLEASLNNFNIFLVC